MRKAVEDKQWVALRGAREGAPARLIEVGEGASLDVAVPCTVIGGRNGAGKSRVLRTLERELGDDALLVDLHHLCEQALMVLRSRDDFGEIADEVGAIGPDEERLLDVQRVVGREYDYVEWYALDVEPADEVAAKKFRWGGDQSLVPFFRAAHRGTDYTSREMGLGEFSVHFMFWILEQYRDRAELVLLLDEPDAYLPPVGVGAFLARLLRLCAGRGWSIVLSTHSEELIRLAVENEAFVLLGSADEADLVLMHSIEDVRVADVLLARPSARQVLFCEDESAYYLTRSLLDHADHSLAVATAVVWRDGEGYLRTLHKTLPRSPRPDVYFGYVFDGDQRRKLPDPIEARWPAIALPTEDDPDALFKSLRSETGAIAARLGVLVGEVARVVDSLEGKDPHDWVTDFGEIHGRQRVLWALADLWCERNPEWVEQFGKDLLVIGVR